MILPILDPISDTIDASEIPCQQLIREARRQLGAFYNAVRHLHGDEVARSAGDMWVEEVKSWGVTEALCWRSIQIAAASRLALSLGYKKDELACGGIRILPLPSIPFGLERTSGSQGELSCLSDLAPLSSVPMTTTSSFRSSIQG